jgi:hypothetical protein
MGRIAGGTKFWRENSDYSKGGTRPHSCFQEWYYVPLLARPDLFTERRLLGASRGTALALRPTAPRAFVRALAPAFELTTYLHISTLPLAPSSPDAASLNRPHPHAQHISGREACMGGWRLTRKHAVGHESCFPCLW